MRMDCVIAPAFQSDGSRYRPPRRQRQLTEGAPIVVLSQDASIRAFETAPMIVRHLTISCIAADIGDADRPNEFAWLTLFGPTPGAGM
jgi:hypothetical protein